MNTRVYASLRLLVVTCSPFVAVHCSAMCVTITIYTLTVCVFDVFVLVLHAYIITGVHRITPHLNIRLNTSECYIDARHDDALNARFSLLCCQLRFVCECEQLRVQCRVARCACVHICACSNESKSKRTRTRTRRKDKFVVSTHWQCVQL